MDKKVEINEVVTFVKATREEALALAYDIGGGEVHALHIQRGFSMPAEKPVGYLVRPLEKECVELTEDEFEEVLELNNEAFPFSVYQQLEAKRKDKNT